MTKVICSSSLLFSRRKAGIDESLPHVNNTSGFQV